MQRSRRGHARAGACGRGRVIDAVYHNVCGGVTAGSEDVWSGPPEPGLVPVFDRPGARNIPVLTSDEAVARVLADTSMSSFCNSGQPGYPDYARKYYRWQIRLDAVELTRIGGVGRVRSIAVEERRASGRVRKLRITGDGGSRVIEKDKPIRDAFGLPSSFFVLRATQSGGYVSSVEFIGGGNGHGVGLCQMGRARWRQPGMTICGFWRTITAGQQVEQR